MASPPLTHPIVSAGSLDMRKRGELFDDSCDDNHDDIEPLNYVHDSTKTDSSCLVTALARSWQREAQSFECR